MEPVYPARWAGLRDGRTYGAEIGHQGPMGRRRRGALQRPSSAAADKGRNGKRLVSYEVAAGLLQAGSPAGAGPDRQRTAVPRQAILPFVMGPWSFDPLRFSDKQTPTELTCADATAGGLWMGLSGARLGGRSGCAANAVRLRSARRCADGVAQHEEHHPADHRYVPLR